LDRATDWGILYSHKVDNSPNQNEVVQRSWKIKARFRVFPTKVNAWRLHVLKTVPRSSSGHVLRKIPGCATLTRPTSDYIYMMPQKGTRLQLFFTLFGLVRQLETPSNQHYANRRVREEKTCIGQNETRAPVGSTHSYIRIYHIAPKST